MLNVPWADEALGLNPGHILARRQLGVLRYVLAFQWVSDKENLVSHSDAHRSSEVKNPAAKGRYKALGRSLFE